MKVGYIPKEYVVYQSRFRLFRYMDSEATFRNIMHLSAEKEIALKIKLNEALLVYVRKSSVDVVKFLLTGGANSNITNQEGKTPLYLAMMGTLNKDLIKLLLDHDTDPNIAAKDGRFPLIIDLYKSEIAELLLKKGANPNRQTVRTGFSALHCAVAYGQIKTTEILLQYGANPSLYNHKGQTPLELAMSYELKSSRMIELLRNSNPT